MAAKKFSNHIVVKCLDDLSFSSDNYGVIFLGFFLYVGTHPHC